MRRDASSCVRLRAGLHLRLHEPYRHSSEARFQSWVLLMLTAGPNDPIIERIRRELRSLGYVDGQTIHIEYRGAQGQVDRLPQLAQELVDLKVDAIVVGAESIARAAKQATTTIPIIMVAFDYDPVAAGLVDSLSRPGGNVTGVFPRTSDLVGKNLALLKELLPRRVACGRPLRRLRDPAARGAQVCRSHAWRATPAGRSSPSLRLQRGIQGREEEEGRCNDGLELPAFLRSQGPNREAGSAVQAADNLSGRSRLSGPAG